MDNKNKLIIITAIILIIIIGIFYLKKDFSKIGPLGSAHEHADFRVFINGKELNFAHPEYMVRDKYVHIEDMIGTKIHKHAIGITFGYFFKTLGFEFNKDCFILDNKEEYCNNDEKRLKFYVNSKMNYEYGNYEIREGDKYLVSYGDESEEEIQEQLESITS